MNSSTQQLSILEDLLYPIIDVFVVVFLRKLLLSHLKHARIKEVLSEGAQLWPFFLVDEGREDKLAIISLPAKRHLNGISLACRWWPNIEYCLGSFVIVSGDPDKYC